MHRAKPMTDAELFAEGERILAKDHSESIERAKRVRPAPTPPISLRLSAQLLDALEKIATAQHRKRANLIQHALWEYVRAQEAATDDREERASA